MDFFPTGFQYYRAPTPDRSCWDKDLKKMSEEGFNTVKYWVMWRWSERKEGVFDFSDLDELMDIADKYGLKVVLNIILDVSPVWFTKKYPDADFVGLNGVVHRPMATNCRQIGGVPGPCVHHEAGVYYRRRFVEETAKHFIDHPALWVYDVWNEPNLNWKGVKNDYSTMICYCDNSVRAFQAWLGKKYGDIEKLNDLWGKCYNDFEEVEPPRIIGMSNEFIDWREFFCESTTADLRMRVEAIKKYDRKHPVMCHTVPYPIFSSVVNTTDDFALAAECDLFGNSVGSNGFAANMLVDSARGKDVFNAEVHMVGGHAITGYKEPGYKDIKKHYFIPLARGIKGYLIWQYRPESLGDEAPCWGNVDFYGENRKWQYDCVACSNELLKYKNIILGQKKRKAKVAIYYEPKSEMFCYSMTNSTDMFDEGIKGLYEYLYDCNKDVAFIREDDIMRGDLDFEAIYFVSDYTFRSSLAGKIAEYVKGGGTLVLEPLSAMHDEDTGRHALTVPGCGLDEIARVRQRSCYHKDKLSDGDFDDPAEKSFGVTCDVKFGGTPLKGKNFRAYYAPTENAGTAGKTRSVATFAGGETAIWENSYGKGRVITLGTSLAAAYPAKENMAFYKSLGKNEEWKNCFPDGVRADLVSDGNEGLLVVENRTDEAFVLAAEKLGAEITELFSVEDGNLKINERKVASAVVGAGDIELYYVKK